MRKLVRLTEPALLFRHDQAVEDPRDGLSLFGPLDQGKPYGIQAGVIGTRDGIQRFKKWVERIQNPILQATPKVARPPFPGFEAVFRIPWNPEPTLKIEVPVEELFGALHLDDRHQRVYQTVEVFSQRIVKAIKQEEARVDIWFVIVPDDVHKYCRPKSVVEAAIRIEAENIMAPSTARGLRIQPSLFPEDNVAAIPYHYDVNFHNQLKARLLEHNAATQVIRESTIAHHDFTDHFGRPTRALDDLQSAIAWNICTAVFYKAGGRPWKVDKVRDGVCYVGLVFKRDELSRDPRSSC